MGNRYLLFNLIFLILAALSTTSVPEPFHSRIPKCAIIYYYWQLCTPHQWSSGSGTGGIFLYFYFSEMCPCQQAMHCQSSPMIYSCTEMDELCPVQSKIKCKGKPNDVRDTWFFHATTMQKSGGCILLQHALTARSRVFSVQLCSIVYDPAYH